MNKRLRNILEGAFYTIGVIFFLCFAFYLVPTLVFGMIWIMKHGADLAIAIFGDMRGAL